MPSAPLVFRSSCGCFVAVFLAFMLKRDFEKAAMRVAILTPRRWTDGVNLGVLLTLMFWGGILLRCGDVERNPGPNYKKTLKQAKLSSSSSSGLHDTDKTGGTDSGQATPSSSSPEQPTLADIMATLHSMQSDMNSKFEDAEKRDRDLGEQYASLQGGVKDLMEEVRVLRKENQDLMQKISDLMAKVSELEKKTDDLQGRSKRNNLIFYGIAREQNETNEDCEGTLRDLITDKLEIAKEIEFDRVHRINSKPDSPIIARCCFYKDKVSILKCKRKLQGSDVFIGEDFSDRVREVRRKLSPHLKAARKDGQRATMVFDHLFIDGKKFFLDDRGNLKESK